MIWHVQPSQKPQKYVILPNTSGFSFDKWDGEIVSVEWTHPNADVQIYSNNAPIGSHSINPDDATRIGVKYCPSLDQDDPILAAIDLCTQQNAELILVLETDIHDNNNKILNANPKTGGVDPRAYGIGTPDHYPQNKISQIAKGMVPVPHLTDGRAWIVGGGPTVNEIDLDKIPDEDLVVGCNDACKLPQTDVTLFMDRRWATEHLDWLEKYPPFYTTSSMHHDHVYNLTASPASFSTDPAKISQNACTGNLAINFAYLAGASEIVLLGYDGWQVYGQNNWHNDNISVVKPSAYNVYMVHSKNVARGLATASPNFKVINLNPNSKLDAFEKIYPEDYLPGLAKEATQ